MLNTEDYVSEGYRQLSDAKYYRLIPTPAVSSVSFDNIVPELHFLKPILIDIIEKHDSVLSSNDKIALLANFPFKPAKFYLLPKIHKDPSPNGIIKGRPIVSCIGYCTTPASRLVDHYLCRAFAQTEASTVLQDTHSLTNILAKRDFPEDAMIVTADVVSLYTNMHWSDTISAINDFLVEVEHPLCSLIVDLVEFVLENNYFEFDCKLFHQEFGMAMGTPMAVNIANIFLFMHERKALQSFRSSVYYFGRFIDDLCLIVSKTFDKIRFNALVYQDLCDIELTWSSISSTAVFLDLEIFKPNVLARKFSFRTFQKKRNAYLYIPFKSDHPRSNLRSFINAELIRYNRTNQLLEDVLTIRAEFWTRLRRRGYPPDFLKPIFEAVEETPQLFTRKKSSATKVQKHLVFCTTYHPHFVKNNYRSLLKQSFFVDSQIFFRRTKQLFY